MASRDYLKHIVSDHFTDNATIGDELFQPTSDKLYKRLVIRGNTVQWAEIPHIASDGRLDIGSLANINSLTGAVVAQSLVLNSQVLTNTTNLGMLEYDGNFIYATADDQSGRGFLATRQVFDLTSNGATQGPAIFDFYGAGSSINLKESSIYRIEFHAYFTKVTTNASILWTLAASSAPSLTVLAVTGVPIGSGAPASLSGAAVNSAATATNATANLGAGTSHYHIIDATVHTNAATTVTLRATLGGGTATPLAASFYSVTRISTTTTGTFS